MTVKYFGMIAEWTGSNSAEFQFSGTTVEDLKKELEEHYSELKGFSYQVAVNQKIATDDSELKEDDEIALLPPFAGG